MTGLARAAIAVFLKDARLEARTRESLAAVFAFALVVAFIFNFTFDPSPQIVAVVGPGIVWVAYVFTGVLGMNRAFLLERERNTLDGLLLAPIPRESVYLGKLLGALALLLVVEALLLPVFLVLYDLSLLDPWFLAVAAAATVGFAAVGVLFSAIAVHTRAREVLLPLLFLPVALPVVIAGVAGTTEALDGAGWPGVARWLQLIAAFDVVFLILSAWAFESVIEE